VVPKPSTQPPNETEDHTPATSHTGGPTATGDVAAGKQLTQDYTGNLSDAESQTAANDLRADLEAAFGDRFTTEKPLGQGGFGSVFEAFDRRLSRRVAIKATRTRSSDPDKLLREARALAQLRHPGIVAVFDVAVAGGHCFVVSELLPGPSLDNWAKTRVPSPAEAARVAAEVADALAHAHARSIIHRDLKPANVMFADDHRPVLVDFGLALCDQDASTERGVVSGTPAYMSPEQAAGRAHRADGRLDVYGLAATLYTLLCGRAPFRAQNTIELLRQVQEDDPPPPRQLRPDIPAALEAACLKGLAKLPGDRFTTAADFAEALRRAVGLLPPLSSPTGAPLPATMPAAPAQATTRDPRTERRQVTLVQFGFEPTTGEDDDPTEHVAAFQAACAARVAEHGGLTLQAAGTGFLACFGYPTAHEHAPRQAVRAALAICGSIAGVSAAVGTGTAVVTDIPGSPPAVIGDVGAAVAAAATSADGVTITEGTHKLAGEFFDTTHAGEVRPRGATAAIPVYRVTSEREARTRMEAADPARLTPLVGRDREVALLRERWELAGEGVRNVILLVADPGLGKSRLVRTLKDIALGQAGATDAGPAEGDSQSGEGSKSGSARGVAAAVEWYCSPYHAGSPFYPVTDYFERAYQLGREPDPARRLDVMLARLRADGVYDPEDLALFAAMLSIPAGDRLPALALSPDRQKERTVDAVLGWLAARAETSPVLFVVEDLHWVDPSTEALLARFVEDGGEARVLGILTFRPEYDPPWKGKAVQSQVALNRLTRSQVGELVRAQAGSDVPEAVVERIAERTDGVPLFVEEFTRLVADGRKVGLDTAIPASLQDLLLARLDRMASDREVVQLAATIGRTFGYDLIRAASDRPEAVLRAELRKLVDAGLLFAKGTIPRATYTFKHALIQDAAYQSLVKKSRQRLHGRVAAALERSFPGVVETQPEMLAHHLAECGDTGRSIEYWVAAARRAQGHSAHAEAIGQLERGLGLVGKLPDLARPAAELALQTTLGVSLITTLGYANPRVAENLARSMTLCDTVGPAAPRFPVMWGNWAWRMIRDEFREATQVAADLIALAERTGDRALAAEGHLTAACTATWSGDWVWQRQSVDAGQAAFDLPASLETMKFTGQNVGVMLAQFRPYTFWAAGQPDRMRASITDGLKLTEVVAHPFSTSCYRWHAAVVLALTRDLPAARLHAEAALAIAEEKGYPFWIGMNTMALGMVMHLEGQAAAAATIAKGIAVVTATGARATVNVFQAYLADALRAGGRTDEAQAVVEDGLAAAADRGGRLAEVDLILARSRLLQPAHAAAEVRRALDVACQQGSVWMELRAALALAPTDLAPLAAVYARLTEGLELPEPAAARKRLGLPQPPPRPQE
jgi:hypothetical protein